VTAGSLLLPQSRRTNASAGPNSKTLIPPPSCPACSSEYVTRVSRVGLGERFINLFHVYPFRCQLCGHRFKARQRGVTYTRVEEDRREYDRWPADFPITFSGCDTDDYGTVIDISMGGCAFHTDAPVLEGAILQLVLHVSDQLPPVNIEAAVLRSVQLQRVSVEFLRIERQERKRLKRFIRSLIFAQEISMKYRGFGQFA
jgi:PilZ domain